MVYSASERLAEPLREPDHRRGSARLRYEGRATVLGSERRRDRPLARLRRRARTTRTSRAATPRCAPRGGSWIVARPRLDQRRQGQRPPRSQGPQSLKRGDSIELGTSTRDLRAGVADMASTPSPSRSSSASSPSSTCSCCGWPAPRSRTCAAAAARRRAGVRRRRHRHARRPRRARRRRRRRRAAAARGDGGRAARRRRLLISPRAPCSGGASRPTSCCEDTFASSHHARLAPHGDVIVLEDLGSTNGTYLNGEPLRGPQPLHPGDRIRIGDSEFTFERLDRCCASPKHFHASDLGRQRQGNEDNFFVRAPAVRGRRRHGRRPGRRGRVRDGRRRRSTTGCRDGAPGRGARPRSSRPPTARIHDRSRTDEQARRHGHDLHGRLRRRGRRHDRPRRRLARLPVARRRARCG